MLSPPTLLNLLTGCAQGGIWPGCHGNCSGSSQTLGNPLVTLSDLSPLQPKDNGNAGAGGPGRLSAPWPEALPTSTLPIQPYWLHQVQLSASKPDQSPRPSKTRGIPPTAQAQAQRVFVGPYGTFSSRGQMRFKCAFLAEGDLQLYTAANDLDLLMLLSPLFKYWCHRHVTSCSVCAWYRTQGIMYVGQALHQLSCTPSLPQCFC